MIDLNRPIATLQNLWNKLRPYPFGRWVLSQTFGFFVPYTGTVNPLIRELDVGMVRVVMPDCRRVRNHLKSIHAIALANIGEAATGLALSIALPADSRVILTDFRIKYLKKARGPITGLCDFVPPAEFVEGELEVPSRLLDAQENVVATVVATWKVN